MFTRSNPNSKIVEQGGEKHFGNQGRGPNHKGHPNQPLPPPFSLLPHIGQIPLLSPPRSGQVRPGLAVERSGERRRLLLPHPSPEAPRSFGRCPAAARRRGGDAAGNGGDGSRRRRYARRREPRLREHLRHRHSDPGETPSPALRIVDAGAELSGSCGKRDVFEE